MVIGIVGAGFSGTVLAVQLRHLYGPALQILLFEKREIFGLGEAYSTPYPYHLLNVRAKDMSAFPDEPLHFVNWLNATPEALMLTTANEPIAEQFVPRLLYGKYLQTLLQTAAPQCIPKEVTAVTQEAGECLLQTEDGAAFQVNKVVLALGNPAPSPFPFPIAEDIKCLSNPWDFAAPTHIPTHDPVMIVGTGLSMIDTVLTLYHHGHQGKIYALSRRGLTPLPHTNVQQNLEFSLKDLPASLRELAAFVRAQAELQTSQGGDWRQVVNGLRKHFPHLWQQASTADKRSFMRHVLPYWNIHRHRVHDEIDNTLQGLQQTGQLQILAGRILEVKKGLATLKLKNKTLPQQVPAKWLINCMGPSMKLTCQTSPLLSSLLSKKLAALDTLQIGFAVAPNGALKDAQGLISDTFYTLGPPAKTTMWETTAVPDIREQCLHLAKILGNS